MSATAIGPAGASIVRRSVETCRKAAVRFDPYDLAAALVVGVLFVLIAWTFRDYAISNDEEVQQRYGEMIIAYYASGFADQTLFHFRDLYLYGGLFDIIAVGVEKLLPLDPYAVRHLLTAMTGVGGIAAVWATARTIAGPRAGFLAASALAVCGTWYGPMFNHTKDIPFAAAMIGGIYLLVRIGRELPRPRWQLIALFGLMCGCALGIRVLGFFLFAYAGLVVALHAPIGRGRPPRDALGFVVRSALSFVPALVLGYAIMLAAWPWSALAPLNPLRGLLAFVDLNNSIQTVLSGHVYHIGDVPRWYVPTYVAIKLSLWLLGGAALALVFVVLPQRAERSANAAWRKEIALIAFAAVFPILCQVLVDGPADTGMRHFLFTVPPIAVLAGIGLNGALGRVALYSRLAAAGGLALILAGFGDNVATLYRLHPEEYLFFNPLVGGLAGASRRYATDYWVNIMPEAVGDLEHFLDQTETLSDFAHRRRYMVLVCGERLPFEKEADARLQWTRDRSRADFFIAPTHMNCDRYIDGKVVATIKRLGVVIGVVKDRRALVHPNMAGLN